jgi:hypothetical protein
MASTYVNDLRLEIMATGDQSGAWGGTTNTNLELIGEAFSYGTEAITTNADTFTSTVADGATDPLRSMYVKYTGALDSTCTVTIAPNTLSKVWFIENATTDSGASGPYSIIITQGSGANVTIPNGQTKCIATDGNGSGAIVYDVFTDLNVAGDLTVASTVKPLGDTAADDLAAFGYTSVLGAILTGQGSTNDVTLVNDADATVLSVPTGSLDVTVAGTIQPLGDTSASDIAAVGYTDVLGLILTGQGSTNDVTLVNDADATVLSVPTGSLDITVAGTVQPLGDTAAGDIAAIGYTSVLGLILTGQGSTNDVTINNDADAEVIGIATGTTVANFASVPTVADVAIKVAGKESIWVPAGAMYPSTTNPCSDLTQVETTALRPDLKVLDFAAAADDFAQFSIAFPKSWNEGTVTFQPFWTVTGTDTGTVAWALSGIAVSSDDTIDTAFGTAAVTTALAHSGTSNDLMVSVESGAITIAGSPAAEDCCFFQISRDVSADSQTGDARLLGIKVFFTTDAANDA